jgi:hypothetical protein
LIGECRPKSLLKGLFEVTSEAKEAGIPFPVVTHMREPPIVEFVAAIER